MDKKDSKGSELSEERYKHPLKTLREGEGDCDDYALLSYFWAHVHGHYPYLVRIEGPIYDEGESMTHAESVGHVFVWYRGYDDRVIVMDNTSYYKLDERETYEDYIKREYNKKDYPVPKALDFSKRF